MNDKDIKHLEWVYERMKFVHNENENLDYMIRFREILASLQQSDISGQLPKSEVIDVFQKLKDAINDKGCCGNADLIGNIVWNTFEKFGGNNPIHPPPLI
jgi:hypothetical protein